MISKKENTMRGYYYSLLTSPAEVRRKLIMIVGQMGKQKSNQIRSSIRDNNSVVAAGYYLLQIL